MLTLIGILSLIITKRIEESLNDIKLKNQSQIILIILSLAQ